MKAFCSKTFLPLYFQRWVSHVMVARITQWVNQLYLSFWFFTCVYSKLRFYTYLSTVQFCRCLGYEWATCKFSQLVTSCSGDDDFLYDDEDDDDDWWHLFFSSRHNYTHIFCKNNIAMNHHFVRITVKGDSLSTIFVFFGSVFFRTQYLIGMKKRTKNWLQWKIITPKRIKSPKSSVKRLRLAYNIQTRENSKLAMALKTVSRLKWIFGLITKCICGRLLLRLYLKLFLLKTNNWNDWYYFD